MNWSLYGDKNTRFFHVVASTKHNRNMINSISVNGVSLEKPSRVKHEVFIHFKKRFKESWVNRPVLGGEFKLIEGTISHHLVSDFTEAEVWAAIKENCFYRGKEHPRWSVIANEVADGWKKAKQQGLIIKLDFEKAFDSVN
ncbi:uncharacterized protein LOC114285460 [Camellia sinensis]|uniref:uncharacterized protein LOC114285460 n=1 Tax=Camellia sinensis TaxID=4442 RepID=UPI00103623AD|nr:uncharacterized protein LOC114285460 [Camellia sinensis]